MVQRQKMFSFLMLALMLGALWLPVLWPLGGQWSICDQYHYGWAVPFLCAYLFWKRWSSGAIPASDPKVGRVTPGAPFPVQSSKFNVPADSRRPPFRVSISKCPLAFPCSLGVVAGRC